MRNNSDVVTECTSEVFEGVVTVNDTSRSWVAKWQRLEGYVPGIYAVKVNGVVSFPEVTGDWWVRRGRFVLMVQCSCLRITLWQSRRPV